MATGARATSRPLRARGRAAVGLAAALAAACASPPADPLAGAPAAGRRDAGALSAPAWALRPPAGCAAGLSGPTLRPGGALRRARRAARLALAEQTLGVRIESRWRDAAGARPPVERTRQTIRGLLRDARIVALERAPEPAARTRRARREPGSRLGLVWALACLPGRGLPPAARASATQLPAWLLHLPGERQAACELGVAGPTRDPADQRAAALADGRRALADAQALRVHRRLEDDGRHGARVRGGAEPDERARAHAAARARLEQTWTDATGTGPLRWPGVLYARVCLSPA